MRRNCAQLRRRVVTDAYGYVYVNVHEHVYEPAVAAQPSP